MDLTLGAPVSLPGELWPAEEAVKPNDLAAILSRRVQHLLQTQTSFTDHHSVYVPDTLKRSTHVFVRNETRKPLRPTYLGPFRIIKRMDSHYVIEIHGTEQSVAIARLKPAFLDSPIPPNIPPLGRPAIHNLYKGGEYM